MDFLDSLDVSNVVAVFGVLGTVVATIAAYMQKINKLKLAGQLMLAKRAFDAVSAGVKVAIDHYHQTAAAEATRRISLAMECDTPGVAGVVKQMLRENGNHVSLRRLHRNGNGAKVT